MLYPDAGDGPQARCHPDDHEWVEMDADYRDPAGREVIVYECLFCPERAFVPASEAAGVVREAVALGR